MHLHDRACRTRRLTDHHGRCGLRPAATTARAKWAKPFRVAHFATVPKRSAPRGADTKPGEHAVATTTAVPTLLPRRDGYCGRAATRLVLPIELARRGALGQHGLDGYFRPTPRKGTFWRKLDCDARPRVDDPNAGGGRPECSGASSIADAPLEHEADSLPFRGGQFSSSVVLNFRQRRRSAPWVCAERIEGESRRSRSGANATAGQTRDVKTKTCYTS